MLNQSRRAFIKMAALTWSASTLAISRLQASASDGMPLRRANWLSHPLFKDLPLGAILARTHQKRDPHNLHLYFRREIDLARPLRSARLFITGDDYFKFYINNSFVIDGPEPCYPFSQSYFDIPITQLKPGPNCLAAHVYYHGCTCRAFNSGDNRCGFAAALELTYDNGEREWIYTDGAWKCWRSTTFSASQLFGYHTQFNENMDLRNEPQGWRSVGFNAADWSNPLTRWQDHELVPAVGLPLEHWNAKPRAVTGTPENGWVYDFGVELVGHTRLRLRGTPGAQVRILHGEELSPDGSVRFKMRCNCFYEDVVTLTGRDDIVEFFDYRAFRYVSVHNVPCAPEVWVDVRHYPFRSEESSFACSDALLTKIWDLSKHGVRIGVQGGYLDTPQREKGQYIGDGYLMSLAHVTVTGDGTLSRKLLRDAQLGERFSPGLLAVAPGSYHQELCEWSLLWPVMLHHYYWNTGDKAFTAEMVQASLKSVLDWFHAMTNQVGLLQGMDSKKWVLVDWPGNLRGGYDYETTKNDVNTVINAFYYKALDCAAELASVGGLEAGVYRKRADQLRKAMVDVLLDRQQGLFRDGGNSKRTSLHANGFALCFGLVPAEFKPAVIRQLREQRLNCGLYGAPYFIEGLYRAGEHELAYDLLTSNDSHSWAEMLRHGATAPLEAWAPDMKANTSFCQPCGSTPIHLAIRWMLGLAPASPGWKTIHFAPRLPAHLDSLETVVPTAAGRIKLSFARERGFHLTVPRSVEVISNVTDASVTIHRA